MPTAWLTNARLMPCARVRLFCFPYAGGSAAAFRTWAQGIPPIIDVCPVELPGRGGRITECPVTELTDLIHIMAEALQPYFDKPVAFFGHSVGALIAFELARHLRSAYGLSPVYLFVSAHRAPHLPYDAGLLIQRMTQDELLGHLRQLGGMPKEVLAQPELVRQLLQVVQADAGLTQTYTYSPAPPLSCPIYALGGTDDPIVSPDQLEAWACHTTASFRRRLLPGGHFYLNRTQSQLGIISRELYSVVQRMSFDKSGTTP